MKKEDLIIWSSIVIAVATAINLVVAISMWNVTSDSVELNREIFRTTHRPYLGLWNAKLEANDSTRKVFLMAEIKNFGSIPATVNEFSFSVIINTDTVKLEARDSIKIVFPTMIGKVGRTLSWLKYKKIIEEKDRLSLDVYVKYKGTAPDEYITFERLGYIHSRNEFLLIDGSWD